MLPSPTYKYKLQKYSVYSEPVYQVGMFIYREKNIYIINILAYIFTHFVHLFFEINPENEQIPDIFK